MDEPKIQTENQTQPMKYNEQTTIALATLGICLLLGMVGGLLFFKAQFWGINVALFGFLLGSSLLLLRYLGHKPLNITEYALVASALFFIVAFIWRDSTILNGLSLLGILLTVNLAFALGTRQKLQRIEISEVIEDLFLLSKYSMNSYYDLIYQDIQWEEVKQRWGNIVHSIIRGIIITAPLLMIFGFLLTASDARFEETIHYLFNWGWDAKTVLQYLIAFVLCGWITAAVLRGSVLKVKLIVTEERFSLPVWRLGCIETGIILGAINLFFLGFIIVQFTYFFSDEILVRSAYARHGFFQLVIVALLVITLLLFIHWLYKPYSRFERGLYQSLALVMIVMTMIIEASAAYRMYLYTNDYGFTELRFYTSVFMAWLFVLFVWFILTVLRAKRSRFTFGAIVSAMVFIGLLHLINPDAQIAKFNISHLQTKQKQAKQKFDVDYITSLSADAIPTLLTTPNLPKSYHCQLWHRLQFHHVISQTTDDWRDWHWARTKARQSLLSASKPDC